MKTTTTDYRAQLHTMIKDFAEKAHAKYMRNPCERLYWYYLPASDGKWGAFRLDDGIDFADEGINWTVATNESIPRNMTLDQLTTWITERAHR